MQLTVSECDICKCQAQITEAHERQTGSVVWTASTTNTVATESPATAGGSDVIVRPQPESLPKGWSRFVVGFSENARFEADLCPDCRRQMEATLSRILRSEQPSQWPPQATLEAIEQRHILAVLASTNGNKTHTARILGIERSTLDRKLKKYGSTAQSPID